jgi:hypothetical protein
MSRRPLKEARVGPRPNEFRLAVRLVVIDLFNIPSSFNQYRAEVAARRKVMLRNLAMNIGR